jgi:E3 ubiquitin-protein ligase RNF115/126
MHDHPPQRAAAPQDLAQNPIANLMHILLGGTGHIGDYAQSQDEVDRIISAMMEQNAMGNAPPPATPDDIANLPKQKITERMLGENGEAECTICMDSVTLGEEVTMLYCDHWFHEQCVVAWLREHNTCPHCRKSIAEGREMALGRDPASSSRRTSTSVRRPNYSRRESSVRTPTTPGGSGGGGGGVRDWVRNHNPFGGRRESG